MVVMYAWVLSMFYVQVGLRVRQNNAALQEKAKMLSDYK